MFVCKWRLLVSHFWCLLREKKIRLLFRQIPLLRIIHFTDSNTNYFLLFQEYLKLLEEDIYGLYNKCEKHALLIYFHNHLHLYISMSWPVSLFVIFCTIFISIFEKPIYNLLPLKYRYFESRWIFVCINIYCCCQYKSKYKSYEFGRFCNKIFLF